MISQITLAVSRQRNENGIIPGVQVRCARYHVKEGVTGHAPALTSQRSGWKAIIGWFRIEGPSGYVPQSIPALLIEDWSTISEEEGKTATKETTETDGEVQSWKRLLSPKLLQLCVDGLKITRLGSTLYGLRFEVVALGFCLSHEAASSRDISSRPPSTYDLSHFCHAS